RPFKPYEARLAFRFPTILSDSGPGRSSKRRITHRRQTRTVSREAHGVRPACRRFRTWLRDLYLIASVSRTHSLRFAPNPRKLTVLGTQVMCKDTEPSPLTGRGRRFAPGQQCRRRLVQQATGDCRKNETAWFHARRGGFCSP